MGKKTSLGSKTIHALIYATRRNISFRSEVIRETTLAKGHPIYWFRTPSGEMRNTDRQGIYGGVVLSKSQARRRR